MNNSCNKCTNSKNIIIAAIIALILINILDTGCIDSLSNLLVSVGDLMQLGNTSTCFKRDNNMENFYC